MKKGLKIGLIVGGSLLVAGGTWACLTKAGIIPNWFDIELLCPGNKQALKKVQNYEDCKRQEKVIKNDCIDCECEDFVAGSIYMPPEIDGKRCCEGTYYYHYIPEYVAKPIIYLYPSAETKVNIKLGTPENLLYTYPKYNSERGWNVVARPNGDLEDMDTGRKLYALYREGKSDNETNFNEGFVVAGKDIIPFLEEKLAILGLNEREAEEFIVYWLPQMENNEYNLIRFETIEEQDENMPLNITPTPDTVIRVMMDRKSINEAINIPEQQLTTPKRNGFTVVEWGGSLRN